MSSITTERGDMKIGDKGFIEVEIIKSNNDQWVECVPVDGNITEFGLIEIKTKHLIPSPIAKIKERIELIGREIKPNERINGFATITHNIFAQEEIKQLEWVLKLLGEE